MLRIVFISLVIGIFMIRNAPSVWAQSQTPPQQTAGTDAQRTERSPELNLALQLIAAKTDEERAALLKSQTRLVNSNLVKALADEAAGLDGKAPRVEVERITRIRLAVAESVGSQHEIARALNALGNSQEGDEAKLETFQKGLLLSEQIGDKEMVAKFLVGVGGVQETHAKQMEFYRQALEIADAIGEEKLVGNVLGRIGNILTQKGDYISARGYHVRALAIREKLNDLDGASVTHSNLGVLDHQQGDLGSAIANYQKAIEISERLGIKFGIAIDSFNLGNVYLARGDFTQAMTLYRRSLKLSEELGCRGCVIGASVNIANLFIEQGNPEQARFFLRRATDTDDENQYPEYAIGTLADSYRIEGRLNSAIGHYKRLLALKEKGNSSAYSIAETLTLTGKTYLTIHEFEKAEEAFRRAFSLTTSTGNHNGGFRALLGLAQAELGKKQYGAALEIANRAKSFNEKAPDFSESSELYATLGRAFRGLGRLNEARLNFERSVSIIERSRMEVVGGSDEKQMFFGDKIGVFQDMVGLLISTGDSENSLIYAERSKARALLDTLQNRKLDISNSLKPEERIKQQDIKNELVSLQTQIIKENDHKEPDRDLLVGLSARLKAKRLEYEDFRNRIYTEHPNLKINRGELEPLRFEDMTAFLAGANTAIAEFVVADDKTIVFVIRKGASRKATVDINTIQFGRIQLAQKVEEFRAKLATGDLDFQKASRELFDMLLRPAAAHLVGKTDIIIVPDGPLWDLPFQALQDEKGKYLVEKAAVSYAPSLTALREMSKKAKARKPDAAMELLAFGNPIIGKATSERVKRVFMSEKLEPLPEAERLVTTLGKMYGPNRSKVYVGDQAREETAKAESPKYRIVQFATHGILNNVSPMYSHLVLAQAEKDPDEDGMLEAWEIKDLDLKADMVILSACETARGRISNGEGVIGMSWAMFIAGTPTTVASQWKVESSSTTELMLEFHRQLLSGKNLTKAEALRRASLKVMKMPQFKHPSYWAGFVIVGDGR